METETARRRVEMITAHFSAADNISATAVATHVFPLNCSTGLTSINRRFDNRMNFGRQDSRSLPNYLRRISNEQGSSELVPPMFSQPTTIDSDSDVPKVREIQYAVKDYNLPSFQPPKFARTTLETDVPMKFIPYNNTQATKRLGVERKQSPRMDVAESRGKYILLIELPGVSIDDIRIEVNNTSLTVQTTKGRTIARTLSDPTKSAYHKREILEGPFEIMWPLPFDVNPDSVSAEFSDGLLRVTIPKLRVPVW